MATEQPRASFLGIPAKLRLRIYDHHFSFRKDRETNPARLLLTGPNVERTIYPILPTTYTFTRKPAKGTSLAILRSSRDLYHEAGEFFYSHFDFQIQVPVEHWRAETDVRSRQISGASYIVLSFTPLYSLGDGRRMRRIFSDWGHSLGRLWRAAGISRR